MKTKLFLLLIATFLFSTNCNDPEIIKPEDIRDYGFLALNIGLDIEESPAGSRFKNVSTDDFLVTIHNADDESEVLRFDPFSSAPAEVELPTGRYFVRATNLEYPANAAFEQPWYWGVSEVINIDKEELKTVDVTCTLNNHKISFVFSQNVIDNFTTWNATGTHTQSEDDLFWINNSLSSEGYFLTGSSVDIQVHLEYQKVFTGELITRDFETTIQDPQKATHYRINVDASLEDGKIVLNINVDDSFDIVDIDVGDGNGGGPPPDPQSLQATDDESTTDTSSDIIINILDNDDFDPNLPLIVDFLNIPADRIHVDQRPNGEIVKTTVSNLGAEISLVIPISADPYVVYSPGIVGIDLFFYSIMQANIYDIAEVTITVSEAPPLPLEAFNDAVSTDVNTPVSIIILDNDQFNSGASISVDFYNIPPNEITSIINPFGDIIMIWNSPLGAEVNLIIPVNGQPYVVYIPGLDGIDNFDYIVSQAGESSIASIEVTVNP